MALNRLHPVLLLPLVFMLGACSQPEVMGETQIVALYKNLDVRQCEAAPVTQASLRQEVARLVAAGIEPVLAQCAHDGRMYPAVCGAPTGAAWLIQVTAPQVALAEAQGYQPLDSRSPAEPVACQP